MNTIIDFFDAGARQHPQAPCLTNLGQESLSYALVQSRTCQIARGLQERGFEPGFHGAVYSGNTADGFIAVLAIARADGVWLPVNARNAVQANVEFLEDMDCDILFYQGKWREQVAQIRTLVPRIRQFVCLDADGDPADLDLAAFTQGQSNALFFPACRPGSLALIMGTGGTTGRSKGVMLSHRNIAMTFASHMSMMNVEHRMVYLAAAPITHTAGIVALPFMSRGANVILMDGIEPQNLLRTLERERVSMLFLPPTVIYGLLSQPNVRDFDYSALRYMMYGAAPMSPDKLAEAIDVFGPVMFQIYGQAEVPAAISALPREDHFVDGKVAPRQRLLSAGRLMPFVRTAIMDNDGRILTQPGERGEIVAQGDQVMLGYYKNPEGTAEVTLNGWHRTGDVGYIDAEGFLYIVDRKKDMIITGGFNVFSSEVEAALMAHPAVKDCAVIGVPDPKWGELVKGIVELRQGQSVEADELIQFVKGSLGSVKAPKSVEIVSQLPRSAVGKVLKKELRQKFWAGQERVI